MLLLVMQLARYRSFAERMYTLQHVLSSLHYLWLRLVSVLSCCVCCCCCRCLQVVC
jgi:hypothetical protein